MCFYIVFLLFFFRDTSLNVLQKTQTHTHRLSHSNTDRHTHTDTFKHYCNSPISKREIERKPQRILWKFGNNRTENPIGNLPPSSDTSTDEPSGRFAWQRGHHQQLQLQQQRSTSWRNRPIDCHQTGPFLRRPSRSQLLRVKWILKHRKPIEKETIVERNLTKEPGIDHHQHKASGKVGTSFDCPIPKRLQDGRNNA